jgi:hypothetical protein
MDQPQLDFTAPIQRVVSVPYQRGSATSKAAAERARSFVGEQGAIVLTWIRQRGERGATQKEAEFHLGLGRPSLCARFRALEQVHAILKTGDRRDGCRVYRAMVSA